MNNVSYTDADILEAAAFCNPVNLAGAMGRGLAGAVAKRWPAALPAYRAMLRSKVLREGSVGAWKRSDGGWILHVPTKRHWRERSPAELVAASVAAIGATCERRGIREVSVPPLGCGLGGLDPKDVLPLVLEAAARHPNIRWVLHRWPQDSRSAASGASEAREAQRPTLIGKATVGYERVREILTRATGFIGSYDYTLNPYFGCTFGCAYCYAAAFTRNDAERDGWGRWVRAKDGAVEALRAQARRIRGTRIYASSVTDPYQPLERKLGLSRALFAEVAKSEGIKLVVQTRSPDVARDIDVFRQIEAKGGRVQVNMTVTTDDERLRRAFEPWCPTNRARLAGLAQVREAGIRTAVTVTPMLRIESVEGFAETLAAVGADDVIIQGFHTERGAEQFVASTRSGAIALMAEQLGCSRADFEARYNAHYDEVRTALKARLGRVGEGRAGFRPPF